MRRLAGILLAAGALLCGTVAVDAGSTTRPIRANQHFIGLVNGHHEGAVVFTICPGPAGGEGRPAAHQSVAVRRVAAGGGDTGSGGGPIYARISPATTVTLTSYGQRELIPTTAQVPCDGPGTVIFSSCPLPQPCGAGAAVDNVPVTYVDIATRRALAS